MGIKHLKLFAAFVFVLSLASCGTQKRLYTKGFYSHRSKTPKKPEASANVDTLMGVATNNPALKIQKTKVKRKGEELTAATSPFIVLPSVFTDACDTIILKNGAKITANIKDAGSAEIKYRTCPTSNGLYLSLKKSDVNRIHYGNGRWEVFEEEHANNQPANLPDSKFDTYTTSSTQRYKDVNNGKRTNIFGIIGLVASFVPLQIGLIIAFISITNSNSPTPGIVAAVMILAFISLILCITAALQISKNKESQKGMGMAIFGILLSLVAIVAMLALLFT